MVERVSCALTVRMGVPLDDHHSPVFGKQRSEGLGARVSSIRCTEYHYRSHGLPREAFCDQT